MKDPAFLFYSSDFLTGTSFFSDEQVGKYIRLICHLHQHGHLSEKQVKHICGGFDEDIFSKLKQDENGLYYNQRLDLEAERRRNYSESRRNNRKKKDMLNTSKTYVPHMENENENINEDISNVVVNKEEKTKKISKQKIPKKKLTDEEFIQERLAEGKSPAHRIDCHLTFLTKDEYESLCGKYGGPKVVNEMIIVYDAWKSNHAKGVQAVKNDYKGLTAGWAYEKAMKVIQSGSGYTAERLRKQEKTREEVRQQLSQFQYTQVDNTTIEIQ